jgi:probable rRNA maturation factor
MNITCEVEDPRWGTLPDAEGVTVRCVSAALGGDGRSVNVLFTSDAEVRVLNRDFRGIDAPTNVLSFPAAAEQIAHDGDAIHLGDIALALETIEREAKEQGKPLLHHVSHLIVHGTLHLLGYDHDTDAAAEAMEAHETAILGRLGIPDPYLT